MSRFPKVVIIGGGFGGINAAKELGDADVEIILIDKTNHHLFQPLLYQVAGSALAPRDIAYPIREILKKNQNTYVIMDEVTSIHKESQCVELVTGESISYHYLVVAIGSHHSYFGHNEWRFLAPGLKTLGDALHIRREILMAYERAENRDMLNAEEAPTFVVVGGGPTGVEMAGAIAEISQRTLAKNFRRIDPAKTKIYLIEAAPRLLPSFPEELSIQAERDLKQLGVDVLTGLYVTQITDDGVYLGERCIPTKNVIWAAGNEAPKLMETLRIDLDTCRRAFVDPDLSIPGFPELFVIGDCVHAKDRHSNPLPGIAPVAIQQGKYVGAIIKQKIPKEKRKPFEYNDRGILATIGRAKAVGVIRKWKVTGYFAWLVWSFVHILYLIGFRNRLFVMLEWAFWYFTGSRSSRLIYHPFIKR